uniref:Uncharacterized protein n=1 Tax=Chromera velia CCMP2878 TaxID=1169474 RepID=A0A0G4H8V0_9ALVE|eukprot:Cvel_25273.t1-p1 / transcript=Cvel_25273.t1 / gene=Cvel_25273 / organism=Chromera_velia_CCMP2878 / gene_product=hypothetical protein / transcript_product=hypothetical protein / location=Cvel_scaffold2837:13793-14820(-) / protein_length=313 / sequence_SO=supercontig / SO=protein_coding / is_pseudo=false
MCILGLSVNQRDDIPFVCIHNRDEDLSRPTVPPCPSQQTDLIYGFDKKYTSSTWMGLHRQKGLFACVNNFRSKHPMPSKELRGSRGVLVQRFLQDPSFCQSLKRNTQTPTDLEGHFPGFSIVHGDLSQGQTAKVFLTSNRPHPQLFASDPDSNSKALTAQIPKGAHAMSNGSFDDVSWPKVLFLKTEVSRIVENFPKLDTEDAKKEADQVMRLKEIANQKVFIAHDCGKALPPLQESGTRSQTIVVRTRSREYFFFRSTDEYPKIGDWIWTQDELKKEGASLALFQNVGGMLPAAAVAAVSVLALGVLLARRR